MELCLADRLKNNFEISLKTPHLTSPHRGEGLEDEVVFEPILS